MYAMTHSDSRSPICTYHDLDETYDLPVSEYGKIDKQPMGVDIKYTRWTRTLIQYV